MQRPITATLCAAAVLACAWPAPATPPQEPATKGTEKKPTAVEWPAEGLAGLPAALARANAKGRRLLVGLSGGPG